jgi:hypothetical protein
VYQLEPKVYVQATASMRRWLKSWSFWVLTSVLLLSGAIACLLLAQEDRITKENAEQLHSGMSAADVIFVLGRDADSKYHNGGGQVWFWSKRGLQLSDDPDAVIRSCIAVQFNSKLEVDVASFVIHSENATWLGKLRARLGL